MDKQQAYKELSDRCEIMNKLFNECVKIADEAQVEFDLPWGGEGCSAQAGYGAGATYYPDGVENYNKWSDSAQWVSSTATC